MKNKEDYFQIILTLIFLYIVGFFLYWVAMKSNFFDATDATASFARMGQVGDTYGAFNAFVSGLALLGLVGTIALQAYQFNATQKTTDYNQIETSFFTMVTVLQDIRNSIVINIQNTVGKDIKFTGIECFSELFNYLHNTNSALTTKSSPEENDSDNEYSLDFLIANYEMIYSINNQQLGHYFRFLYNIFKYLKLKFNDDSDMIDMYLNILQAQLSNHEMALIMCNALSKHGKDEQGEYKFKQWLDDHNFFQNIDRQCILDDVLINQYPKTRFKFLSQA